jgi:hypothetical protein
MGKIVIALTFPHTRGFFKIALMATPIKNIEKEIILKSLYDQDLSVIYYKDRVEYVFLLKRPAKDDMLFRVSQPIEGLKVKDKINLTFDYRGKTIAFNTEILYIEEQEITCTIPDYFYKDLDRSYSRVSIPAHMQVQFTFLGDRYDLSFPKVQEYDTEELGYFLQNSDPKDLSGLIEQMATWIKHYANGYKLVLFKDAKPSITEERIIAETGKALFLPSTQGTFPESDPSPRKRIITEAIFKRYLESTGVGLAFVDNALAQFIKEKADNGILSEAWIPIHFHEYVIGYIHIWNDIEEQSSFNLSMIDTLYQFTKVLAYSLEINGYFEEGKVKDHALEGKVIDISVSGLLFAQALASVSPALQPESKLTVKMVTPERGITTEAVIVRCFKDSSLAYYGCQFEKMGTEDFNYLFEFIYGKPFSDFDVALL